MGRRIVVLGAESTGKTTLCELLSKQFSAPWIPEYGRDYTIRKYSGQVPGVDLRTWTSSEFAHIALEQQRLENEAAASNPLIFADTNALATAIWHELYLGSKDPETEAIAAQDVADLYLIAKPDIPYERDEIREGEHTRTWMHRRFLEAVAATPFPFAEIEGLGESRLENALRVIEARFGPDGP